jgi:hypothetical protein
MHLPISTQLVQRPIYSRWLRRQLGLPLDYPTRREVNDALRILADPERDELYEEAERTLAEWD